MEDRYPLSPVPGDSHSVVVEFKNRGARATFSYDPTTSNVRRIGIQVDSPALDIPAAEFVGFGPLQNAMDRAAQYFAKRSATPGAMPAHAEA